MARKARHDFGHAHFPRLKNGRFRHFQVYIHHTPLLKHYVHLKIKNNFLIQDVLGGLQPHKPPP